MAYDYSELLAKSQAWVDRACASGWLKSDRALPLLSDGRSAPRALFDPGQSRPLIVAFMGGTGVGKSSLLNRLAGAQIAKTGIIRPTSKEVTLYHHQSVSIRQLPTNLPFDSVKFAEHRDDGKKNIVWIDMPDLDSIEQSNHHLVLQWLPHVDVLVYVVSPERYKDDKAWRLLLAEGGRHAWLFVLNQWDRGWLEQYDDFKRQLAKAGFAEPIIFRTVCGDERQADEFSLLAETIVSIADEHTVKQLEIRGLQIRQAELRKALDRYRDVLGSESAWRQIADSWQRHWPKTADLLTQGFAWPIQQLARYYADHAADLIVNPTSGKYPGQVDEKIWDAWAQSRFDDALDEFIDQSDQLGVPVVPIKTAVAPLRNKASKWVVDQCELAVRKALANPGNSLQRFLLKCVRFAEFLLPTAAMAWVAYRVFIVYYHGGPNDESYLGTDFAIHSSLLIAIAWLAPWFILKKAKPSLHASALRGLNQGLATGLCVIDDEVADALAQVHQEYAHHLRELLALIDQCEMSGIDRDGRIEKDSPLHRMLIGS